MKNRLLYIDQLKGIAIFLVVLGHSIENNTVESAHHPLFTWIYSFHMPLFMFISGYTAFKTISINSMLQLGGFIRKRAISLLVPYFVWPLLVYNFFFKEKQNIDFVMQAWNIITKWNPLWYLWFLFFLLICYAVFHVISNLINKKNNIVADILLAVGISCLLIVMKPLGLLVSSSSFLLYFLFFFLGVFASKYPVIPKLLLNQTVFSLCLVLFIMLSGRYDFYNLGNLNKMIKIIISLSAIASLYYIVHEIKWNTTVDKYVQLWGRNTIVIYTTHFSINWFFKGVPLFSNLGLVSFIFVNVACTLIVLSACLLILNIVKLSPVLNLLLYGHQTKKLKIKYD